MHLVRNAAIVAVVLVIVLAGLATAAEMQRPDGFFLGEVRVEMFEDGSGRAVNAAGETLVFCMQGYPCDNSISSNTVYLPLVNK